MYGTPQRGFIGLIPLLIVVALMGFIFWRSDILSPKTVPAQPGTADLLQGSTQIEQGTNAIQAARNAKQLIEQNTAQQQKDAAY